MTTLAGWLSLINLLMVIAVPIGGIVALRAAITKAENDVQQRVREALSAENELLRNRVQRLETENKRQSKIMQLLIVSLQKLHGIELDIDEDVITLRSSSGSVSRVNTDSVL